MESDEHRLKFLGRVRETWRETLGNFATTDGETKSLFARLTELGTLSRDEAARLARDVRVRIDENRRELDTRIDATLDASIGRLSVPGTDEISALEIKLDELTKRLNELEMRR